MIIQKQARVAFTLMELLIVMTIIAVLIGLLLPAIQQVRESARRTDCRMKLMNIGVALHSYWQAHGVLPPGSVDPLPSILSEPKGYHFGWITQILPHIEESVVYDHFNFTVSVYHASNTTIRGISSDAFICPSDPYIGTKGKPNTFPDSCYAGVHHSVEAPIAVTNNGLLYLNSSVLEDGVKDGRTYTLLVGEKVNEETSLGWATGTRSTLRNLGNWGKPTIASGAIIQETDDPNEVGGFSSYHTGVIHFLCADGRVGTVTIGSSPAEMQKAATRAGKELVELNF